MRIQRILPVVLLTLVTAAPAAAQTFELTPFGGWRWGGELEAGDNALFDEDVDIDESGVYGLRANFALSRQLQLEVQASRQSTQFTTGDDDLFSDDEDLLDVNLDTLQVGLLFQGGDGQIHPFGVVAGGLTRLDPEGDFVDEDERLSASFGGGVKIMVAENVGLRLEGRYYWIDTEEDDDDDFFDDNDDDFFDDDWDWDGDVYQGEVTIGLIIAM
jgi:hypothetical protein